MDFKDLRIGVAMCGSFCTFESAFTAVERLRGIGCDIVPIMSENSYTTDTRFGDAKQHIEKFESICNKKVIHTISDAEPIGPQKLLDVLIIIPCTGNTLAKLANGITDTCVTMAAKAHLRNKRPLVLAIASNDSLGANAKNIGILINSKDIYFVPFFQDDAKNKENSLTADLNLIEKTIENAINNKQLQPVMLQ